MRGRNSAGSKSLVALSARRSSISGRLHRSTRATFSIWRRWRPRSGKPGLQRRLRTRRGCLGSRTNGRAKRPDGRALAKVGGRAPSLPQTGYAALGREGRRPCRDSAGRNRAEGLLIRIDCPDTGIVFVLQRGNEEMRLEAGDPSQVQMAGSGAGRSFACGEQKPPIPVEAEFSPAPSGQAGTGRLLRLSVRN